MSSAELDQLIKMINQIADNIAIGDSEIITAPKVADHIMRFWARPMKEKIIAYATNDGEQLNAVAKIAVAQL
jgi:formate dehydrogenase subunit delta